MTTYIVTLWHKGGFSRVVRVEAPNKAAAGPAALDTFPGIHASLYRVTSVRKGA